MPRGTRAIHGAEVTGHLHPAGKQHGTHVFVVEPWLPINCWCERHVVMVEQAIFRTFGITLSCGAPDCCNPDDHDRSEGLVLSMRDQFLGSAAAALEGPITVAPQGNLRYMARIKRENEARARREARVVSMPMQPLERDVPVGEFDRELRRDSVLALWRQDKRAVDIAIELGLEVYTVHNDIAAMRKRGQL